MIRIRNLQFAACSCRGPSYGCVRCPTIMLAVFAGVILGIAISKPVIVFRNNQLLNSRSSACKRGSFICKVPAKTFRTKGLYIVGFLTCKEVQKCSYDYRIFTGRGDTSDTHTKIVVKTFCTKSYTTRAFYRCKYFPVLPLTILICPELIIGLRAASRVNSYQRRLVLQSCSELCIVLCKGLRIQKSFGIQLIDVTKCFSVLILHYRILNLTIVYYKTCGDSRVGIAQRVITLYERVNHPYCRIRSPAANETAHGNFIRKAVAVGIFVFHLLQVLIQFIRSLRNMAVVQCFYPRHIDVHSVLITAMETLIVIAVSIDITI